MDATILTTENGAILYDPRIFNHMEPAVFEPASWPHREPVSGMEGGTGRGATTFVQGSAGEFALRHYHRGGLVAAMLDDRYLWLGARRTRPFREWRLLARLHEMDLPVPRPAAARYRRHGFFYTGDLLTCRLPETAPLSSILRGRTLDPGSWEKIGETIRRFHDAGVWHADLNAHNVVLGRSGDVFILDFDRGELRRAGRWREQNLARLRRSLDKIRSSAANFRYRHSDWQALLRGYRLGDRA